MGIFSFDADSKSLDFLRSEFRLFLEQVVNPNMRAINGENLRIREIDNASACTTIVILECDVPLAARPDPPRPLTPCPMQEALEDLTLG